METRKKVITMAIMLIMMVTAVSVLADDSSAGSYSVTEAEQKLNESTRDYYLFIYFNQDLAGVGEATIIETGFHSAYNVDDQNIKNRLVFIIGDEPYDSGTYTMKLTGGVETLVTFSLVGEDSDSGSSSTIYIIVAVVLVIIVIAAIFLYKRNH